MSDRTTHHDDLVGVHLTREEWTAILPLIMERCQKYEDPERVVAGNAAAAASHRTKELRAAGVLRRAQEVIERRMRG